MISKLKKRFVILGTVLMFILMSVLVLIMNIVNYSSVVSESDKVLDVLSQPNAPFFSEKAPPGIPGKNAEDFIPRGMSPEVPYESRFFSVTVTEDGSIADTDLSRIVSVDRESAEKYINRAVKSKSDRGFIGQFRYLKKSEDGRCRILFLDCGRKLDTFYNFLWISAGVGLFGCVVLFVVFLFASGRIVKPIAESYEKQKRFISDAGHEIKTPLTIINANVDLIEEGGNTEELCEIKSQTKRLTELTNNLVMLSKMEETEHTLQKVEMPLSDIVFETASSFRAPAEAKNTELHIDVVPGITLNGSPDAVRQLVSVLTENAVKYSPENSAVYLDLSLNRKNAVLSVINSTRDVIDEKSLANVFDRFYRSDSSRNSETGGHGIGLSIAKAVTEAHGGSITACTKTGRDFCVTVLLPV